MAERGAIAGFNRTFLVLKSCSPAKYTAGSPSFNRTFLVLKLEGIDPGRAGIRGFNRTFLVLKLLEQAVAWMAALVLIAPFWY